jgi:hypothetical protein
MMILSLLPVLVAGDDRSPAIILVSFRQHSGLTGWNLAAGRRLRELETGCTQRWFQHVYQLSHLLTVAMDRDFVIPFNQV